MLIGNAFRLSTPKSRRRPGATIMSSDRAILLISDRPDRSRELGDRLAGLCSCRTIGVRDHESAPDTVTAVVTDLAFRDPARIEHLRQLLAKPRAAGVPIVAILRDDSYLERVQAAAIGATSLLSTQVSFSEISALLAPVLRSAIPWAVPATSLTPEQNVELARLQFGTIFGAAARSERIDRASLENTTESVIAAVTEGGIRRWLEVVWTYDDATYQHCLLVSGLAAEFATSLKFAPNDQKHVIRGALLHDLGKAKIPLAVLHKPGPLTAQEAALLRTHTGIGYELLRDQGGYEPALLEVVLRHHELLDGSGYPDGLAGSQINDLVRLVTICDIYAALIERRAYKAAMDPAQAFALLEEMEGKLEGALVRAFAHVAEKAAAPVAHDRRSLTQLAPAGA
jgi:putative nucleotidyltransferase with HDIG domain